MGTTAGTEKRKIVLIDDQVSYAEALGLALSMTPDLQVAGQASDRLAGQEIVLAANPELVVTDYRLPGADTGIACATFLREAGFEAPIVILTGYPAPQVLREAAGLANITVMSKDLPILELIDGFREMIDGHQPKETGAPGPKVQLSAGELEVLELLNQGVAPADIAEQLYLSLHTIRARIKSLLRKLDANSQLEALATATRLGLLVPPT